MAKVKLDLKGLKTLKRSLEAITESKVQVGHFDGELHPPDEDSPTRNVDTTFAEVGYFVHEGTRNEQGQVHSVARPYIATAFKKLAEENGREIVWFMRQLFLNKRLVANSSGLRKIGGLASRKVKQVMRSARKYGLAENRPRTIKIKKHAYPTMETRALRRNVRHRFIRRSKVVK